MSNIERDKATEAVEDFLRDTFEAPLAMGEEWLADQADNIVELVLEALQPRGAVEALREIKRIAAIEAPPVSDEVPAKVWKIAFDALNVVRGQ